MERKTISSKQKKKNHQSEQLQYMINFHRLNKNIKGLFHLFTQHGICFQMVQFILSKVCTWLGFWLGFWSDYKGNERLPMIRFANIKQSYKSGSNMASSWQEFKCSDCVWKRITKAQIIARHHLLYYFSSHFLVIHSYCSSSMVKMHPCWLVVSRAKSRSPINTIYPAE